MAESMKKNTSGRSGDGERRRKDSPDPISPSPRRLIISLPVLFALTFSLCLPLAETSSALAQSRQGRRQEAHSKLLDPFTPANHALVERAIAAACLERQRDPFGSAPIDEMQARPSLPVSHPD